MKKISIIGQIAEIDREIAMRQRVYPEQVRTGKMRQAEADMLMERAYAIRATLMFCREHEADIRAYMVSRSKGGEA
ncbi:hypothetical protein [Agrobacterium sp. MS2]|uniref:hypothetical protein n=1 Tax=Agrobacterium sp. MS2 TaxID=1345498 RepID=UPI000DC00641|nr:hypothetical protein [Agrobacterium sp. MS2]RAL95590.1 hypothetical protein DOU54_20755 [Agrobacterium sp. MS2]